MLSMPPATKACSSPAWMDWAANMMALRPEPQTLLTVTAGMSSGRPAEMAAWRAGAWPIPAVITLPMMTSSMASGAMLERWTASFMAMAPSWGAVKLARLPRYLPVGVRAAPTMTAVCSDMICVLRVLCGWFVIHFLIKEDQDIFILSRGGIDDEIRKGENDEKSRYGEQ